MRLIDADALVEALNESGVPYRADVQGVLDAQPTADAVRVVRCKDCTYYKESYEGAFCSNTGAGMDEDGYCSDGERKEDDETD